MKEFSLDSLGLSSLLDAAPDALVIINRAGKMVYINAQMLTLFGYTADELLGEVIEKLLPDRYRTQHQTSRDGYFTNPHIRQMGTGLDLYGAKKDGQEFPVQISLSPLESQEELFAFAAIRDATEIKALERTRLEAEVIRQAKERQQSRADEAEAYRRRQEQKVDELCHELRNPLQGIYGNVELLKHNLKTLLALCQPCLGAEVTVTLLQQMREQLEQMNERVQAIETCADHQKIIADDVLTLSKLEAHRVELNCVAFNPQQVVNNVVKMLKTIINDKKLKLIEKIPLRPILVGGDPDRLTQVLINLLTNAVKFTPAGGVITISLNDITVLDDTPSVQLQFVVQDTGIGMTSDEQSRIFDRFAQGSRKTYQEYGGSGLGLTISKGLVELMGGEIHVVSQKDQGSTFSFSVQCTRCAPIESPLLESKSDDRSTASTPKIAPLTGHIILVVEDNLINQKILVHQLERAGVKCYVANHGQDAIDLWKTHPEITFILMDIEMPILNGLEATKTIRQQEQESKRSSTPIIGLSGNAGETYRTKALQIGMNDYLTKPYKIEVLSQKILHWRQSSPITDYHSLQTRKKKEKENSATDEKKGSEKAGSQQWSLTSKMSLSDWISYLSQSAHRGHQYEAKVAGQKKIFTQYEIKNDGNCGFYALGVTRMEAVEILRGLINNTTARKAINNELIESYRNYQISGGTEIDPTQFMAESTRHHFIHQFELQHWNVIQNDAAIFKTYVNSYDHQGGGLWLGIQSMAWIARAKQLGFHLWGVIPSTRTLQLLPLPEEKTIAVNPVTGSVNILIQGGHYDFLVEETEGASLSQSEGSEAKLFKKLKIQSSPTKTELSTDTICSFMTSFSSSSSSSSSLAKTSQRRFSFTSNMSSSSSCSSSTSTSINSLGVGQPAETTAFNPSNS
jgi:PAS domain S-box-containing protein